MSLPALRLAALALLVAPALGCDPDLSVSVRLECADYGVESPVLRASGSAYAPDSGLLEVTIDGGGPRLAERWCDDWLDVSDSQDSMECLQSGAIGASEWEASWVVDRDVEYTITADLSDGDAFGNWDSAALSCPPS